MSQDQILKRHFLLMERIISHYDMRKVHPAELEKAVSFCREQIALAPQAADALKTTRWSKLPAHTGFEDLAAIREEGEDYAEAIALCMEAKRQGWGLGCKEGKVNWDEKIKRCTLKRGRKESNVARSDPPTAPLPDPPAPPTAVPGEVRGAELPEATHFTCPHCQTTLIVPVEHVGKRGMCRDCQGLIDVPAFNTVSETTSDSPG
jgi:hypothetical protein